MPNAKDLKLDGSPSILIVGDPGSGKTTLLSQIPGVFVFDFDKGMAAAQGRDVEFETFKDAPVKAKALEKHGIYPWGKGWSAFGMYLDKMVQQLDQGALPFSALAFDSLTFMGKLALDYAMLSENKGKTTPEIQHYGAQINLLRSTFDQITSWPIPVVVTAHLQRDKNDLTGEIEKLPLITGKFAGEAPMYFDEIWFMKVSGAGSARKYTVQTASDGVVKSARSRYGVPDGIAADWSKIAPFLGMKS